MCRGASLPQRAWEAPVFRPILVPLDGSRFAEAALPPAAYLARRARGRLHLMLAHQPAGALVGGGEMVAPLTPVAPELGPGEGAYVEEPAARVGDVGGGPIEFQLVDGPAGPAVCEEASRVEAVLVVMATPVRCAIGRLWFGSVADYAVRHSPVPTLLVHPERGEQPAELHAVPGILVALDLSPHSEAVLESVIGMARLLQSHVTLLHVLEPFYAAEPSVPYPMLQDPTITEVRRVDAQRHLDRIADRLRERGFSASTRGVIGGGPAAVVLETLQDRRFGLVALTTHGAGGMKRLFLGSVADKVIRSAAKPVLVRRPEALRG